MGVFYAARPLLFSPVFSMSAARNYREYWQAGRGRVYCPLEGVRGTGGAAFWGVPAALRKQTPHSPITRRTRGRDILTAPRPF